MLVPSKAYAPVAGKFVPCVPTSWGKLDVWVDVWDDLVKNHGRPEQRVDDFIQDLAILKDGTLWVGSIPNSLARISSLGKKDYLSGVLIDKKVTALEAELGGATFLAYWNSPNGSVCQRHQSAFGMPMFASVSSWKP